MAIRILTEDFAPSEGKFSYVDDSIKLRSGRRDVESSVRIVRLKESAWYNRVSDYDDATRYDYTEDGTLIINSPNIFTDERAERKGAANAFFPAGSVILALNIRHEDLGDIDPADVLRFAQSAVFDMVLRRSKIETVQRWGNDILFGGKKFYGEEVGGYEDCYSITAICTCEFEKYKEQFADLRNPGVREITGITDEIPALTQEAVMQELYDAAIRAFGVAENE